MARRQREVRHGAGAQKATAKDVQGAFLVSAGELKTSNTGTHFDAASQLELGERFAAWMKKAIGG